MAVNTHLFDFSVAPVNFETVEAKQELQQVIEQGLNQFLPDLKKISCTPIDGGILMLFIGGRGLFTTVRGFREGVITINIEYYKNEDEDRLLDLTNAYSLTTVLKKLLNAQKGHKFPPFTRGGNVDKYFVTADDRILEYDIDKIVFEEKSPYQNVQIVHSKSLGNLLVLDELQNMSESDLIYTETLMNKGVENYTDKEIVILGGGDGCLLWELLKEKPKFVTMLELDEVVMKACAIHLRSACGNCLDNYRGENYEIVIGDCHKTLKLLIEQGKKVDYVFGDLTDIPVDTSEQGEMWDFIKGILNMSFKIIKPGGKYMTHGNGASVPKSLEMFENIFNNLDFPVEYTKSHAFIPSFLEDWVFYQLSPVF